jgi:UDP-N-acetylmuramoyl-L-alanyl-D-glutamate--2,6-diaminopimelate ligase
MITILVTGTNGKTSVCYFLEQLCLKNGISCSRYSSTGSYYNGTYIDLPDAFYGKEGIADLRDCITNNNAVDVLIWETFSSGLAEGIYDDWQADLAILTNISQDHIALHGSLEHYKSAKYKLFRKCLKKEGIALIANSKATAPIVQWLREKQYHLEHIDYNAPFFDSISEDVIKAKTLFTLKKTSFLVDGFALFNIENLRTALTAFLKLKYTLHKDSYHLKLPPGRLNTIVKNGVIIVVDYAHNEDAFLKITEYAKTVVKGKLIVVFGCGGDRDNAKRRKFGEIAQRLANHIIITDDNSRQENPESIRAEIQKHCPKALNIADRYKAISKAIALSQTGDMVLVLGRGHEQYQNKGELLHTGTDTQIIHHILI